MPGSSIKHMYVILLGTNTRYSVHVWIAFSIFGSMWWACVHIRVTHNGRTYITKHCHFLWWEPSISERKLQVKSQLPSSYIFCGYDVPKCNNAASFLLAVNVGDAHDQRCVFMGPFPCKLGSMLGGLKNVFCFQLLWDKVSMHEDNMKMEEIPELYAWTYCYS